MFRLKKEKQIDCLSAIEIIEKTQKKIINGNLSLEEIKKYNIALDLAKKSLLVTYELPKIVKIINAYKDPIPQDIYARRKNAHYENTIVLLKELLRNKGIKSTETKFDF